MMHLIRCLFFLEAWFGFEVEAVHLPGRDNMLADDLSRNHLSAFLSKALSPDPAPTLLPRQLPELLLDDEGWTSPCWTILFYSIATTGQLTPPRGLTSQASTGICHFAGDFNARIGLKNGVSSKNDKQKVC